MEKKRYFMLKKKPFISIFRYSLFYLLNYNIEILNEENNCESRIQNDFYLNTNKNKN